MNAPRMRIAGHGELLHRLEAVGHQVVSLERAELVINPVVPVRAGQMVASEEVVTLGDLDGVASSMRFVLSELTLNTFAVSASDEVTATVAELLIAETGGQVVFVPDSQRERLLVAQQFAAYTQVVAQEANAIFTEALGNPDLALEVMEQSSGLLAPPGSVQEVQRALNSIQSPERRRLFIELSRRSAELFRNREIELWAMKAQGE
ncbi:hypothetical protein [Corynebacterium pseudopelargi]|uniref:CGL2689-like C-terminal domain-containing protein n=1 Tax=Corynebacterium pseudopelargi TaxID=2080757 RepID=A0A3G6IWX2_9CORY|nr:hypothetical protein [Corynebacterium pseudopelargi]AZA08454.1 hypothetical protein CPPEL_01535 [Corynebacterium pseudopelargi]